MYCGEIITMNDTYKLSRVFSVLYSSDAYLVMLVLRIANTISKWLTDIYLFISILIELIMQYDSRQGPRYIKSFLKFR